MMILKGADYMSKVSTNISIDADTKVKAQALLSEFGMDLSTAVNVFFEANGLRGHVSVCHYKRDS